jgi:competence protein ComEC
MHDAGTGLWAAILLMAGTCMGLAMPPHASIDLMVDVLLVLGMVLAGGAWCLRQVGAWGHVMAMTLPLVIGFISAGMQVQRQSQTAAIGLPPMESMLVRCRATLLEPFRPADPEDRDLLDRFQVDAAQPSWRARARLVEWREGGGAVPASGVIMLRTLASADHFQAGDLLECTGWLTAPQAASNPGQLDATIFAWRQGMVGSLRMEVLPSVVEPAAWWCRLRHQLQSAVDRNIVQGMPMEGRDRVATLVVAMTSGRERLGYATLRTTFASTGLSHFLAISGFNVAVLFAAAVVCMELGGVPGSMRGWCLAGLGLLFMAAVDVEVSVLRAGVAGVMAGTSLALARGWRADGVLAAAATGTLILDPWMAWNPGFQLSYAAVLALRHGSGPVERVLTRLGMPPLRGVRVALAASVAAWMVSTPITMAWFGTSSPWCALTSTALGPLAASLTVTASVTACLGWLPGIDHVMGHLLWAQGWLFLWMVECSARLPGCRLELGSVPWWWAVLALTMLMVLWKCATSGGVRMILVCALLPLAWPWCAPKGTAIGPDHEPGIFRWTCLAIGDGSVHLIQSGGASVLFDAGSISMDAAGSRVVVPALRAMGVDRIQAIILSHPHLDHFSAVPEVVSALHVERVMVGEAWRSADPESAAGVLMAWLRERATPVDWVTEGFTCRQAGLTWTALHPPSGFSPRAVNDGSLCFRISRPEEARPLALLLGDAQDEAIARLLNRKDIQGPWVMELPHHGGWRPATAELCRQVRPSHVMQSTGSRRFDRDRLGDALEGSVRGVTCRDGAIRFSLDLAKGRAWMERWWRARWWPLVP